MPLFTRHRNASGQPKRKSETNNEAKNAGDFLQVQPRGKQGGPFLDLMMTEPGSEDERETTTRGGREKNNGDRSQGTFISAPVIICVKEIYKNFGKNAAGEIE